MEAYPLSLLICSGLSVVSSGTLIGYYICSKKSRSFSFSLVLPVFIYDFMVLIDWFAPLLYYIITPDPYVNIHFCRLQGFLRLWRTNGTFFSTLVICWVLYSFFIRKKQLNNLSPIMDHAAFTIVLPLFISILPLITNRYGHLEPLSEVLCFIVAEEYPNGQSDILGIVQKTVLFFLPFLFTLIAESYFILRILYHFWKTKNQIAAKQIKLLLLYPLFLVLSQSWAMYERFYEIASGGVQISWLNSFDLQMFVLNGFLNSIIYGYISLNICFSQEKSSINSNSKSLEVDEESEQYSELNSVYTIDSSYLIVSQNNLNSMREEN